MQNLFKRRPGSRSCAISLSVNRSAPNSGIWIVAGLVSAVAMLLAATARIQAQSSSDGFIGGIQLDLTPDRPVALRLSGNPTAADEALQFACPVAEDDLVIVDAGRPAPISLPVQNLGGGEVTIFQYPLGGMLQPAGPSTLDYVYIPDPDFRGWTTMVYRVTPPNDCPDSFLLGTVTIAVGEESASLNLGGRLNLALCGFGFAAPLPLAGMLVGIRGLRRRR